MCCLFGLIDYHHTLTVKQKNQIISALATAAEARGVDATGIAYNSHGKLCIYKRPVPGHKMRFHIPQDASVIIGHTRATTQGSALKNRNNHPFEGRVPEGRFALTHNGVLFNDTILRRELHLSQTNIETDSYISVQIVQQAKALNFSSLRFMAEQVEGSFSFAVLDNCNCVYLIKGDSPLCMYHYPARGVYLYSSTEAILKQALQRIRVDFGKVEKIPLDCGEIMKISANGGIERGTFDDTKLLYRYDPFLRHCNFKQVSAEKSYIQELKDVAMCFGYRPEDVDNLIAYGLSPFEIEEYFYSCEEASLCVF